MHLPSRRALVVVGLVAAFVVVLLGLAVMRSWSPLLAVDSAIADPVHAWAVGARWAVKAGELFALLGAFTVCFAVTLATVLVVLVVRRAWRVALAVALIAMIAPEITEEIKEFVGRARPVWIQPLAVETTASYPSGHATAGLAVYAVCGLALAWLIPSPRWSRVVAWASIAFGIVMGLSRIVLGVHWTSDVVGGWAVAVAVAALVAAVLLGRGGPLADDEPGSGLAQRPSHP